jgi:N-acetylglucosamine-6-sulfatase
LTRRLRLILGVTVLVTGACEPHGRSRTVTAQGPRPNIVVVVIDDLRWDEFGAAGHPFVQTPNIDRLVAEGAWFTNAFHAVPLCSPNRASMLTGQFPSRHGIVDNVARDVASHRLMTFPMALREHGYETGFVGKWHMGNDATPRPGFDFWVSFPGQGRTVNPQLYEDGRLHEVKGYVTDLLSDRAVTFINTDRDRPFLLYLAHKAVHPDARQLDDGSIDMSHPSEYVPAPRHRGVYDGKVFPRRPNVVSSPDQLEGKPALRRALAYRASEDITRRFGGILDPGTSDETIRRRAEMLLSVDEGLGRIFAALEAKGILDRTMIILTSDNGFFFGEHGLSLERRMPYEESIRNPLIMRYPQLAAGGTQITQMVLSVDLAPTVLEIAQAPVGEHIQGLSLLPLLRGESAGWRDAILVEFYSYENPMPWLVDMDDKAIRTERWKYVHWVKNPELDEMYDLEADPFERANLIDDDARVDERRYLRERLSQLVLQAVGLNGSGLSQPD